MDKMDKKAEKEPKTTKQSSTYKVKEENINKMHEYLKKQNK